MSYSEWSDRLNVLRFPLIIGVVFIHNYDLNMVFAGEVVGVVQGFELIDFIRNIISQGIARSAVPVFFLMSGFFLFLNHSGDDHWFKKKIGQRFKSLLVPFLFWNIATLLILFVAQSLSVTQSFFSGRNAPIASYDFFDFFDSIFGLTKSPISYQFWFIRDLMLLVLVSPVIKACVTRIELPFLLILTWCWVFEVQTRIPPSIEAIYFFSIGCAISLHNRNLFSLDFLKAPILIVYTFMLFFNATIGGALKNIFLYKLTVFIGVLFFLCLSKSIVDNKRMRDIFLKLSASSFFVFAAHEPLLTMLKKIYFKLINPSGQVEVVIVYLFLPLLLIGVLVVAHRYGSWRFPRVMRIVSGGR